MNNFCAFSKNHHCIKWNDYQLTRLELEEADSLCHSCYAEIESLQRRINILEKLLRDNDISFPNQNND
ncbi:MAG: mobility-associated LCxxNW protein [Clostridiales bacterium]|nr:mobility-associated LCxxNW protein [Clostridiales bacterium]